MGKLMFDRMACSRCGGSGQYSFNPMDGSRCFKCHGVGTILTKVGLKAREDLDAWCDQNWGTVVTEIKAGDRVWVAKGMTGVKVWKEVLDSHGDRLNVSYWTLVTKSMTYGWRPNDKVWVRPENFDDYLAYAKTLTGCTVAEDEMAS